MHVLLVCFAQLSIFRTTLYGRSQALLVCLVKPRPVKDYALRPRVVLLAFAYRRPCKRGGESQEADLQLPLCLNPLPPPRATQNSSEAPKFASPSQHHRALNFHYSNGMAVWLWAGRSHCSSSATSIPAWPHAVPPKCTIPC